MSWKDGLTAFSGFMVKGGSAGHANAFGRSRQPLGNSLALESPPTKRFERPRGVRS
jgi:hypothetical protein